MRDLLEIAMKAAGKRPRLEIDPGRMRPPASEVRELVCASSAARARLGWQPRVGLEEGVARTARWMADNLALYRPPFAPF
jgi:nucleoside-diphosphate-sugar epimerase